MADRKRGFWEDDAPTTPKESAGRGFWETDAPVAKAKAEKPGMLETAARSAADMITLGLADEAFGVGRGVKSLFNGGGFSAGYDEGTREYRERSKAASEENPITSIVGSLAGGVGGGLGLARAGLSATANAVNAGRSLPAVMVAGAKEGAALSAAHGVGSGEGLQGRAEGGAVGAGLGAVAGSAGPALIAGASKVAQPFVNPLMARLRPDSYANVAVGEGLERAGMSAEDVGNALLAARADGQGMFTVADALGHSGQRMLSTAARNPHNERQAVVDSLIARQMDQGRRIAGDLGDASGSVMSAQRFKDLASASRRVDADINYAPVAAETAPIDVSPAVAAANRAISPAADNVAAATGAVPTDLRARASIEAGEAAIRDPIRQAVKEARSYLAADSLTVTNVEKAFRAKTNIDMMIAKAVENKQGAMAEALQPIQAQLDDALARTSPQYASARDAYRAASQPIDAVDIGREMASPRNRSDDTLRAFSQLTPEQQHGARIGYFDPLIARAESAAGTMTNSARPFLSESMRRELPELAAPGQADLLTRRLGREARMSETAGAALGGSKTADNLADAAAMAQFDPGIMTSLMRGRPVEAIFAALSKGANEAKGLPPRVIERVARTLMETDPQEAMRALTLASQKNQSDQNLKALGNAILLNWSSAGMGRHMATRAQ